MGGFSPAYPRMKTSDFDYYLPEELIAQHPAERREDARMMVVHRDSGCIEHRHVADMPDYLNEDDLLVLNDTKVIPARVYGKKAGSGGRVEVLFLEQLADGEWEVLLRASRRPKIGGCIELADGRAVLTLLEEGERGRARVAVQTAEKLLELLDEIGEPPLPPYIGRDRSGATGEDRERYQTVYATHSGAVAAPTAGLHFSEELLARLEKRGVEHCPVTLHVGIGTFRPVMVEQVEEHHMDEERYVISSESADRIAACRSKGGRVVAVGSTSVRTLETVAVRHEGLVVAETGRSGIFIYPPYTFQAVDAMLTNFHLPQSTLLMMVSALAGRELIEKAYREAVEMRYRFFSYGDCMLIL